MGKKDHFCEKVSRILGRRGTIFLTPAVTGCKNFARKTEVLIDCFCLTVIIEKEYGLGQLGRFVKDNRLSCLTAPPGKGFTTRKVWRFTEAM